jgi:hypothetical protein
MNFLVSSDSNMSIKKGSAPATKDATSAALRGKFPDFPENFAYTFDSWLS